MKQIQKPNRTSKAAGHASLINDGRSSAASCPPDLGVVIDMFCSRVGCRPVADATTEPHARIVDKRTARRIIQTLTRGSKRPSISVNAEHRVGSAGNAFLSLDYEVRIEKQYRTDSTKDFVVFLIEVRAPGTRTVMTRMTVKFSRNNAQRPTQFNMILQANPTTLLTGQNTWPATLGLPTIRHVLALVFTWPAVVLLRILTAIDSEYRPPRAFRQALLGGDFELLNVQFSTALTLPENYRQVVSALLADAYLTRHYPMKDGGVKPFRIGSLVRVEAESYEKDGIIETVLLRKMSGDHCFGSASFYDKGRQLGLSTTQSRFLGLSDFLRAEFTLHERGLNKLLNDASRLASTHKVEAELDRSRGEIRHTEKNVITAMLMIDALYETSVAGQVRKGFTAWLMREILFNEFHLDELFGRTSDDVARLESLFVKLGRRDTAYDEAFKKWEAAEERISLRECLIKQGISADRTDRCMRKVRELGFSGFIPATYWKLRELHWASHGATDKDARTMRRRLKKGKSVAHILKRNQANISPAIGALQTAMLSLTSQDALPRAHIELAPPEPKKLTKTGKAGRFLPSSMGSSVRCVGL